MMPWLVPAWVAYVQTKWVYDQQTYVQPFPDFVTWLFQGVARR